MKTYLTIDLDYWVAGSPDIDFLRGVVGRLGDNVSCAVHHHHILSHVAAYRRASRLINIDAHSDLPPPIEVGEFEEDKVCLHNQLNAGSWAIYVDWPHRELFSWVAPDEHSLHEGQIVPPWLYGPRFCDTDQMDEGRWDHLRWVKATEQNVRDLGTFRLQKGFSDLQIRSAHQHFVFFSGDVQ